METLFDAKWCTHLPVRTLLQCAQMAAMIKVVLLVEADENSGTVCPWLSVTRRHLYLLQTYGCLCFERLVSLLLPSMSVVAFVHIPAADPKVVHVCALMVFSC